MVALKHIVIKPKAWLSPDPCSDCIVRCRSAIATEHGWQLMSAIRSDRQRRLTIFSKRTTFVGSAMSIPGGLWHEQTPEQQRRKEANKRLSSRTNALLNKKAALVHAANGVIKYGLPKIQPSTDDTTECINAIGVFAQDLATWLQSFARYLNKYINTEDCA